MGGIVVEVNYNMFPRLEVLVLVAICLGKIWNGCARSRLATCEGIKVEDEEIVKVENLPIGGLILQFPPLSKPPHSR